MNILIAIGVRRRREAGAAGVALNHARELENRGHHVECWFLEDVLGDSAMPARFLDAYFAIKVARRVLKNPEKFDVVNIHAPSGWAYGLWRKFGRPANSPPYVMTMQGSEERYAVAMRMEHQKGRATNFAWKNRVWHCVYHQAMYDFSIKTADYGVVADREGWILSELKHRREPGRISFLPNGTEERFFLPRRYEDKGQLKLLYAGSWLDRKGIYYLAEAFEELKKRVAGVELTVAGCVVEEAEVRRFFPAEAREQLRVIPFISREEMPGLYMEHDIFVFPSLVEGMPLTLLEAMATGMPVVTTNTCGMADVVEDEVNGLLVGPADSEGLAAATERLCRSVELRKQFGLAAQATAERYTWERIVCKLEKVLQVAVQNERTGRNGRS